MKLEKDFIDRLEYEDLKNYDTINIGENDIEKMKEIYKVIEANPTEFNPILSNGVIKLGSLSLFFNIIDNSKTELIIFNLETKKLYMLINTKTKFNYYNIVRKKEAPVFKYIIFDKSMSKSDMYIYYLNYIGYYTVPMTILSVFDGIAETEEIERIPRNRKEREEYNTTKSINKQPIKLLKKKYKCKYLTDEDIEHIKRNYNFSFGVRGHKRHYEEKTVVCKNGQIRHFKEKTIDIKPFIKGEGKYRAKKYEL